MSSSAMDPSSESVHSLLLNLDLPTSVEDCRNPSQTFIVHILSEFFQRFFIDVATIKKMTMEQNNVLQLTGPENAEIVSHINLSRVMTIIGSKIFIKDFTLSDITSPGPKRTRKNLKLLANFTLYTQRTRAGMESRINEVLNRGSLINELRKKSQSIIEATNKKAGEISQIKAMNERIQREIEETLERIEKRKDKINKFDAQCKAIEQKKQQAVERNQVKRAEVKKLEQITDQLKAKVVMEPESYKLRLQQLEEECRGKTEERAVTDNIIQSKKPMIKNLENALSVVERQHAKLPEALDLHKKLLEFNQVDEALKRQIEEATHLINSEANLDEEDKKKITEEELKKCEAQCEKNLAKLRNTHAEMSTEKKALERKLANMETRHLEICSERDQMRGEITEVEGDIAQFLRECQELYNQDIKNRLSLHETVDRRLALLFQDKTDENNDDENSSE